MSIFLERKLGRFIVLATRLDKTRLNPIIRILRPKSVVIPVFIKSQSWILLDMEKVKKASELAAYSHKYFSVYG